jgi:predicted nucleic acid-binding protein
MGVDVAIRNLAHSPQFALDAGRILASSKKWRDRTGDRSQPYHVEALAALQGLWDQGGLASTTNWALLELTALLTRPLRVPKPEQIRLLDDLRNDPAVLVVPVDPALETSAWALWAPRPDKDRSLVDCASFDVMRQRGLAGAVRTDHHFEQAGLTRLLK